MVAKRHKITNVPLFKKLWDIIFLGGQSLYEPFLGTFWGGLDFLDLLKMSLKMAHKVIVPQKKIISRSFLNSGTIIVIIPLSLVPTPSPAPLSPSSPTHRYIVKINKNLKGT